MRVSLAPVFQHLPRSKQCFPIAIGAQNKTRFLDFASRQSLRDLRKARLDPE
jgi:hypothetical protein